jgi:flavin-dependent dehydrogenase
MVEEMTADARARSRDDRQSTFDVAIIGAGPAGAAAARQLASWGHSVALVGRGTGRRALAESLPPSCTKLLDRLGIRDAVDGAGFVRATGNTVRWAGQPERVEFFEAGVFGYQVQRDRFDNLLVAAARGAGATVIDDAVVRDAVRDGDDWRVDYEHGSGRAAVRAPWLLDCTGRAGVVARRGWRQSEPGGRTTAVIGVWESDRPWPVDDDSHTLVESYDGGWAWSVPVSATRRYVTVMLDPSVSDLPGRRELAAAYRAELRRTEMLSALVEHAAMVEPPWGCDASPYCATVAARDSVLLVGDAASFVDPLSSFGVKKALASAWLASVAVHTALLDSGMATVALGLFANRERAMYEHLQRQSAGLSREAAGAHASDFWRGRGDASFGDASFDESSHDLDIAALRSDPRVLGAFERLKLRSSVNLRFSESLRVVERATVRGNRVVLESHLVAPDVPHGVRYCRNVDLVVIAQLAGHYAQVPDLFDAYNRAAPPAPLPDFLGALSTLIGLEMLSLA